MRKFIACLLLGALLGMIPPLLPAQQNQSAQRSNTEIEALKKRVSELEKQLQTVENADKMDLQAKPAEANAKLADTDFEKFERKLRDSNNELLRTWSSWFLGIFLGIITIFVAILGGVSAVFWSWLRSRANQLIANEVEKNLTGFKEALKESGILKNQLGELEEAVVVSMLERTFEADHGSKLGYPEQNKARREEALKELREEPLSKIFANEKYHLAIRHRAAEILARKSSPLVTPVFQLLNSTLDSDAGIDSETGHRLRKFVHLLGSIHTQDTYQGLKLFLNRLLTEDPKHKDLFLTWTVFSLGWVSVKLDMRDSRHILKASISDMKNLQLEHKALRDLARHFDILDEPAGIKEILINHATSGMPDVKNKCLELLQKHDPEFVKEQRAKETTNNSEA